MRNDNVNENYIKNNYLLIDEVQMYKDFENKTFIREVTPLLQIKDAYPKILIANTKHDTYQYEGIQIINISDWLIEK